MLTQVYYSHKNCHRQLAQHREDIHDLMTGDIILKRIKSNRKNAFTIEVNIPINYDMIRGFWGWIIIAGFLLNGCYETTRQITPFSDRDYQRSYKHGESLQCNPRASTK